MQSEEKKLSFGFSFADEKIKLIDILTENDDFLAASPFHGSLEDSFSDCSVGFRMSAFRNSPELRIFQQKYQNQLPSDLVQLSSRPSFHRKSLAWDSEFFDSPGVLDQDELSCINKGFKTADEACSQDMRKQISELKSRPNLDASFCADWFEIEPSIYKPKSKKTFDVASKALKKGCRYFRNEAKSNQTSTGKNINKMEPTTKRRQAPISSPKPQNALGRNISTISKVNSSTITYSDQALFTKKKPSSQSRSSLFNKSGSNAQTPNLLKRKTESRESRLRASLSASMIWRGAERYKNISPSKGNWSSETSLLSSVDINEKRSHGSKTHVNVMKIFGGSLVRNDENEDSHLQSPLNTPKQYSRIRSIRSLSAKSFRPSGLRPPSPQIGFFDENTCHDTTVNRKLPPMFLAKAAKAGSSCSKTQFADSNTKNIISPDPKKTTRYSWAPEKLKSTCSEVAKNIKRPKTYHTTSSSLVSDQENQTKKNLSCYDVDQLGNLSRCFGAIDLKGEKLTQLRKRAPLADKTSSCNSGADHLRIPFIS